MREIKFRMLTQTTDKILGYVDVYDLLRNGSDILPDFEEAVLEGVEFEQYTGLKDKNGKEIYEGDIVKDESGYVEQVGSLLGGWLHPFAADWGYWLPEDCEVVGNIHENPELLRAYRIDYNYNPPKVEEI